MYGQCALRYPGYIQLFRRDAAGGNIPHVEDEECAQAGTLRIACRTTRYVTTFSVVNLFNLKMWIGHVGSGLVSPLPPQ